MQTIAEREQWPGKVDALKDECIMGERAELLIDKGNIEQAKDLLFSVPWQKLHQTYTRIRILDADMRKAGRKLFAHSFTT